MKKIFTLVLVLTSFFAYTNAQSLTKTQKKQVKKELKSFKKSPESYVAQKERNKSEIERLKDDLKQCQDEIVMKNQEIGILKDTIAALRIRNLELTTRLEEKENPPAVGYRVQVGYYKVFDINKYLQEPRSVKSEEIDGANRYSIGYFTDLDMATSFRNDLRKMGIRDAFISEYHNGVRNMEFKDKK
jgi:septal ring factor EnvC (AmiA/AmiB activator)